MSNWFAKSTLAQAVETAGFIYDPDQEILFSRMDAVQRNFGYAYGYDAAALPMGMAIDCEPIFFDYGGKHWMIELWKGQYGLETGCEVGIYRRVQSADPGILLNFLDETVGQRPDDPQHSRFYQCADDSEMLEISLTLYRSGKKVLSRGPERHWWLTGFKWGVYSDADDLTVDIAITFTDPAMKEAFLGGLKAAGYVDGIRVDSGKVSFTFAQPHSHQPRKDPEVHDLLIAVNEGNQGLCAIYRKFAEQAGSNDPNELQPEAFELIVAQLDSSVQRAAAGIANMANSLHFHPSRVVNVLMDDLKMSIEAASAAVGNAGYALWEWVGSAFSALESMLDWSCIVEIDNRSGQFDWIRKDAGVVDGYGSYVKTPPAIIRRGQVGRFVLANNTLGGSDGWVEYHGVDASGNGPVAQLAYSCPQLMINPNTASASPPFTLHCATGRNPSVWNPPGVVPATGSPLSVSFVASEAPPMALRNRRFSANPARALFMSAEHLFIGDSIKLKLPQNSGGTQASEVPLALPNKLQLTYGCIAALGGDFFGVPGAPICLAQDPEDAFRDAFDTLASDQRAVEQAPLIMEVMKNEAKVIQQAIKDHQDVYKVYANINNDGDYNAATGGGQWLFPKGRYLDLAEVNFDHFGAHAVVAYSAGHSVALQLAAGARGDLEQLKLAYAMNAFADHFLSDLFSAGHLRTPRLELYREGEKSGKPGFVTLYNLLVKEMHDEDSWWGLEVVNAVGHRWRTYGDMMLFTTEGEKTRGRVIDAVQASADEIYQAFDTGVVPQPSQYAALMLAPDLSQLQDRESRINKSPLFTLAPDGAVLRRKSIADVNDYSWDDDWYVVTTLGILEATAGERLHDSTTAHGTAAYSTAKAAPAERLAHLS